MIRAREGGTRRAKSDGLLGAWLLILVFLALVSCSSDEQPEPIVFERVTNDIFSDHSPEFSPDGRRILFESTRTLFADLWIYDLQQDTLMQLTDSPRANFGGSWSPDGKQVVYMAFGIAGACPSISILELETLTSTRLSFGSRPAWSPRGDLIVFENSCPESTFVSRALALVPTAGGPVRQLHVEVMAGPERPSWSPDGTQICFAGLVQLPQPWVLSDIWIVDAAGGIPTRMTFLEDAESPSWSPDGEWILFSSAGSIRVVNVRTKEVRTIVAGSDHVFQANGSWSPDGKSVAYDSRVFGERDIWIARNIHTLLQ